MKVDNRLFFEVLIGTYNRPDRAINAIQSALSFNDVIVRCNSNGYEPLLDEFCKNKGNVIYTYFDVNKGACKNWSYLLNSAESEFCMLLSDEDEIDSKYFPDFLDFLRGSEKVAGAIVPFFDKGNDRVMNTIGKKVCSILSKKSLVYRNYSFRGYMSGFIFRTEFVQDVLLNKEPRPLCSRYRYDDYLHVRLLRKMLDYGNILAINSPIVIRNPGAGYGGDSHSHINTCKDAASLNPNIYSAYSRARQYCLSVYLLYQEDWKLYERLFIHLQIFMKILGTIAKIEADGRLAFQDIKRAQLDSDFQIVGIDKLWPYIVYSNYVRVVVYFLLSYFFRILGSLLERQSLPCYKTNKT